MIPITLTPGEERVLEAWRERPGTLADLARRTGVSPSAISRALVRLRSRGLLPSAPRPASLPRPGARLSEAQYSLSQRAAWRGRTWIEDRILALWDTQEYEWTAGDWARCLHQPRESARRHLETLRGAGLIPERESHQKEPEPEMDDSQRQAVQRRIAGIRRHKKPDPVCGWMPPLVHLEEIL